MTFFAKISAYIGYIAAKFNSIDNSLSNQTDEVSSAASFKANEFFTRSMKNGHFAPPSNEWLNESHEIENYFNQFHPKNSMKKGTGIKRDFLSDLKKRFPHRSEKILKLFVRLRYDCRIKRINFNVKIKKKKIATRRSIRKMADF